MLYGLKHLHRPDSEPVDYQGAAAVEARPRRQAESLKAGNTDLDFSADWIDYAAAGCDSREALQERLIETLSVIDMTEDVYRLGLTGTIDPERNPEIAEGVLRAREALLERLAQEGSSDLVIRFDPNRYNRNATLAENLLFGTPTKPEFRGDALAENQLVLDVLGEEKMLDDVLAMGETIAKTIVELFADLPAGHPFFEQFGFIEEDDLPEYKALVARVEQQGRANLIAADRQLLLHLPFRYVEARHRFGLVNDALETKVVAARKTIAERLDARAPGAVEFYRPEGYNAAASLQDNILFGRLAYGQAQAEETVGRTVTEVLDHLGLHHAVLTVGLDYEVGIGGKRLTKVQRQKLAIARALLKQPDLLIVNEAASVLDVAAQAKLSERVLKERAGRGVIWTLQRAAVAENFDRVLVMRAGRVVEQGAFGELKVPGSVLEELIAAG